VLELPARRFTEVTGILLAVATGVLGLGLERLARGATTLGIGLVVAGGLATVTAFGLRVEGDPGRVTFLLVTREQCAHCDEARAILQDLQAQYGFSIWEVDVTEDEALRERWMQEVPVLVEDGRVLASLEVRPSDVEDALEDG
jgi:glutaredoxin